MRKKVIYALWAILLLGMLSVALVFHAIVKGWIGYVPPVEELENPDMRFATQIFSDDGVLLGTYSLDKDNRVFVGYNDLPPHLVQALIATEDETSKFGRRKYPEPAACQAALHRGACQEQVRTYDAETHRVGHSRTA